MPALSIDPPSDGPRPRPAQVAGGAGETIAPPASAPTRPTEESSSADALDAPAAPNWPSTPRSTAAFDPAALADGVERRLHPASVAADRVTWWISIAVVVGVAAVAIPIVWLAGGAEGIGLLLAVAGVAALVGLMLLAALTAPRLVYRHTSYVVSPLGLEIRRGVLWRSVVNIPRSRVQHTDVVQGPVARRHGLATLVLHTAGTANATVVLQGLGREEAFALRDLLVRGGARDGV